MKCTGIAVRTALLLALSAALGASPAQAEPAAETKVSEADLAKAKEHYNKGKELFDKKDFAAAVIEFKESYRISKNAVLLYNVGFTLDQQGQRALALFYYQKFVAAAPGDNPNVPTAKERIEVLQKDIEDASLDGAPAPAATSATSDASAPAAAGKAGATPGADGAPVSKFEHALVDSAPPGKPIDIGAFVPPGSYQVSLYYRSAGEAKFTTVEMKARYNERVGRIPAERTRTRTVQYYIEVRDDNGQLVNRSGKSTSPNLIFVEGDAKPHYYADLGDDESYHDKKSVEVASYSGGGRDDVSAGPRGNGWFDAGSSKFGYAKWGTTASAAGMLALSGAFYLIASSAASSLEDAATSSLDDGCPGGPPCRKFSGDQQGLEGRGQRFETMANVSLGIGAASAVAAGVFWYLDLKDRRSHRALRAGSETSEDRVLTAAPMISPDGIGAAAAVRF